MKTNKEWFRYLSPKEKKQFLHNIEHARRIDRWGPYDEFEEFETFEDFINDAFTWANTPEKHEYWEDISVEERDKPYASCYDNQLVKKVYSVIGKNAYFPDLLKTI